MYAMQYRIVLPADYDMSVIRRRVEAKGSILDDAPGLGLKAYLIRERGQGAPTNEYAPFYLWTNVAAMSHFLWGGGGFQGIVGDFGRPTVRQWTGVEFSVGSAYPAEPTNATMTRTTLDPDATPMGAVAEAKTQLSGLVADGGVHSAALAVDPTRWELLQFALWCTDAPPVEHQQRFTVLHLSKPYLHDLEGAHTPA
jgi:hypothetical protein